jgi:glycosyltransferase A (GT-A) superfamily protein (DUF2064 family)
METARLLLAPGDRGVLGACDDGGYYLLGLKAPDARLFADVAWSTDTVAETTRKRARDAGLDLVELEPWSDIDDAGSLLTALGEADGGRSPATYEAVNRLDIRRALSGIMAGQPA